MESKNSENTIQLNRQRFVLKVLDLLTKEQGISLVPLCEDWVIRLEKVGVVHFIYGYDWGLNTASSQLIAKDKSATFSILSLNNIPAVEHQLFFNYSIQASYTGQNGNWNEIQNYVDKQSKGKTFDVICKPNKGTGGNDVYRISKQIELERVIHKMFSKYRDFCLSPFYEIEAEYRVIILDGEVLLVYLKERPFIIGNGKDNLFTLIFKKFGHEADLFAKDLTGDVEQIIDLNKKFTVTWKHNLAVGSQAVIVEDDELKDTLSELALRAAKAVGIRFASIDIISVKNDYMVMEINAGIMMEKFATQTTTDKYNYFEIAKSIYSKALKKLF